MFKKYPVDLPLAERFNEIGLPKAFRKMPREELDNFFYHRGWLIVVRRGTSVFMRIEPNPKPLCP